MKQRSIIQSAITLVKSLMKSNDPSHDWYHVERVWKNALNIASNEKKMSENLDMLVVELAALFHDAVDFKYDQCETTKDERVLIENRLSSFFKDHSDEVTNNQKESIIHIIMNISWRKELEMNASNQTVSNEMKIVRDADRLEAIGAIGIARAFAYTGAKMRPFYVEDCDPNVNITAKEYNQQSLKNQSTAINHFYEKLLLIKSKIQTETGKVMAQERHDFMIQYLKQFNSEANIESQYEKDGKLIFLKD
jgi:uncharacterized protein